MIISLQLQLMIIFITISLPIMPIILLINHFLCKMSIMEKAEHSFPEHKVML